MTTAEQLEQHAQHIEGYLVVLREAIAAEDAYAAVQAGHNLKRESERITGNADQLGSD